MREHIEHDSNTNSILIFLGIHIGTIIISFILFGLIIAYGDLNLGWAPIERNNDFSEINDAILVHFCFRNFSPKIRLPHNNQFIQANTVYLGVFNFILDKHVWLVGRWRQ